MYSIFFYFPISEFSKIVYILDILNLYFSKIFHSKYEWIVETTTEKLLERCETVEIFEKKRKIIYGIEKKKDFGPYHDIEFFDDSFVITVEISGNFFSEIATDMDVDFFLKIQNFSEEMIKILPIIAFYMNESDESFENWLLAFQDENICNYIDFGYIKTWDKGKFLSWNSWFAKYFSEKSL